MLTPEEQKIAEYGKAQGKSREEVLQALSRYRSSQQTPAPATGTGFLTGVKQDFNKRVDTAANAQVSALQGNQSDASAALQTIGQGAGFVGDLTTRALGAVTPDFIKKPLKAGIQKVAATESVQDMTDRYSEWKAQNPEAAANLESTVNISSLLPIGAIAGKGAQAAKKGILVSAGKALEGSADAVTTAGRATKGAGSALYRSAITPNVKEAERILNYQANSPFLTRVSDTLTGKADNVPITRGQTALERGIAGTETMVGVQAKRVSDKLWKDEIAPAVAKSDVQMTKQELFATAAARIEATTDPTRRAALQNALDALAEDYAAFPDTFDLTKAQSLKRDLAEFTPAKIFKGQEVASEVRTLQADMADAIRQKTYDALADEGIKRKYLDWANLHELEKIGVKAISEGSFKGGSGTLVSGLWDMATVPIKTIGGQVLYRVGNKVEFLGNKGIKSFGQWLQQKGFEKPKQYDAGVELGVGLSIKSNVRPDLVASRADDLDIEIMRKYLENPTDGKNFAQAQNLMELIGIDKADDATQLRFLEDVLAEYEALQSKI